MSLSLFFRVIWHAMSYIVLAMGDKKTYLIIDAIICNGFFFISNIVGYKFNNLTGIAYSYVVSSLLIMVILIFTVYYKYNISINKTTYKILSSLFCLCFLSFLVNYYFSMNNKGVINFIFIFICSITLLILINKRLPFFSIIRKRI